MKKIVILFFLSSLGWTKTDFSKLNEYFSAFQNDPSSNDADTALLELVTDILPEKQENFEKEKYLKVLDQAWAQREAHAEAVFNMIRYLEGRRARLYAALASEANANNLVQSSAEGMAASISAVASPYVANAVVTRSSFVRTSGVLMDLNSRLQRQRWIKNPWLQASSALIGASAGMAKHYVANEMGWSLGNLPPAPLDYLGFNTENLTRFTKADTDNFLEKVVDTSLFVPLTPLLLSASNAATHLVLKPLACLPTMEKLGAKIRQHSKVKSLLKFFNPITWGTMGLGYLLVDSTTDFVGNPIVEAAYYKNYYRAILQLKASKGDSLRLNLAKEELYTRLMELHAILVAKPHAKIQSEIQKIMKQNEDSEVAAAKIQDYLLNAKWAMSKSEMRTRSWMKSIEADPKNIDTVLTDVVENTIYMDIDNPTQLFLYTAAILKSLEQKPELKEVRLLDEAFDEWTSLEKTTISLKGEKQ